MDIGAQYPADDEFRARARRHQAEFRATRLSQSWDQYGSCLTEADGRALLNYYDKLGVREAKLQRFPNYKAERDANMLRSEHIPFNLFGPLKTRPDMATRILGNFVGFQPVEVVAMEFEWAPTPPSAFLNDRTAFDVYVRCCDSRGRSVGVGIEVKYTERGYAIGPSESIRVNDPNSTYWRVTRESGAFVSEGDSTLATDDLRQIWRNHLLGLAMRIRGDIDDFVSVTLYPESNAHFTHALAAYRRLLTSEAHDRVLPCTYEHFISGITGGADIEEWRTYLEQRYVV